MMKIFLAGATGAVGRQLVPRLVARGHEVVGTTRSAAKADDLRAAGAEPVVVDLLDRDATIAAVMRAEPEVVVHEATSLSGLDVRHFERTFALTNRLRTEGTDTLITAARMAGTRRLVAQSYAGWPNARTGGPVKAEEDPLDAEPPAELRAALEAIMRLEAAVAGAEDIEGLVLRYGGLYGPGTSLWPGGEQYEDVRKRRFPLVGRAGGVWSFTHVEDAAEATAVACERGAPGIYNVVDDDPAPVFEWLPYLAHEIGAKPPRRVPAWLGRMLAGEHLVAMITEVRGSSNAKAKRDLAWSPRVASWRQGFATLG